MVWLIEADLQIAAMANTNATLHIKREIFG
jgi:hypothetical protein